MPHESVFDDHDPQRLPHADQQLDLSTPAPPPTRLSPAHILHLQRTIGNQRVQRWLQRQSHDDDAHAHGCGCGACAVQREPLAAAPIMVSAEPNAHAHGCGCGSCSPTVAAEVEPSIQRAPQISHMGTMTVIQRGKMKSSHRKRRLMAKIDKMVNLLRPTSQASLDFLDLWGDVQDSDTLQELKDAENEYARLIHKHAGAIGHAQPPHPAGAHYCDPLGNLIPPYNANIRTHFYSGHYQVAATNALATYEANHPGTAPNTVRCPGNGGTQGPHDIAPGSLTIDHIVPVATHWNAGAGAHPAGRDTTRASRNTFYTDPTNHQYMCGSCNSSKNSGGVYYTPTVTMNFRN